MFKKNIGLIDRVLRIIIGIVLIALAVTDRIGWWGYIGIIPLATGLVSSCLLYTLLGINTAKKD